MTYLPFFNRNDRAGWNRIGSDQLFTLLIAVDHDLRMQFAAVLLHDQLGLTRLLVDVALCRDPFDEVLVLDITGAVANNRDVVLFPFGNL